MANLGSGGRNAGEDRKFVLTVPETDGVPDYTAGIEDGEGVDRTADIIEALGINDKADLSGAIIQVVQGSTTTAVTVSTTTYTDTGLTATITPKRSTSKILVILTQPFLIQRSGQGTGGGIRLLRDSTVINTPTSNSSGVPFLPRLTAIDTGATSLSLRNTHSISKLDTPTIPEPPVAITYKTQGRPENTSDSGVITFQESLGGDNAESTITLLEVAV